MFACWPTLFPSRMFSKYIQPGGDYASSLLQTDRIYLLNIRDAQKNFMFCVLLCRVYVIITLDPWRWLMAISNLRRCHWDKHLIPWKEKQVFHNLYFATAKKFNLNSVVVTHPGMIYIRIRAFLAGLSCLGLGCVHVIAFVGNIRFVITHIFSEFQC